MSVALAIESSQRGGGVALSDRKGAVHVELFRSNERHDDDLLPAIDRLVSRVGLSPRDIGVVGVSIGPGGFTGLRIATATAKMVAAVNRAMLVAAPSALVAATSSVVESDRVMVALASKRDAVWLTRLVREHGAWRIAAPAGLTRADQFESSGYGTLLADEHLPPAIRALCDQAGVRVVAPRFDPAACLAITTEMERRGETTDPLRLSPLYAREPEAVSLWEQRRP